MDAAAPRAPAAWAIAPRWQPFALAALALVALVALQVFSLAREYERAIAETRSDTANVARLVEAQLHERLRRVDAVLAQAAALAATGAPQAAWQALRPAGGLLERVEYVDGDAQLRMSSDASASAVALGAPDILKALAQAGGNTPVLDRVRVSAQGPWTMAMARRVPGPPGVAAGAVVAHMNMTSLQPTLDAIDTGRDGFVTLFTRTGWLVATAPANAALFDRQWGESPLFAEHLPRAPHGTVRQVVVRDNTERVYSYRMLANYPLVVSMGISTTDALASWREQAGLDAALALAVALLLVAAATWLSRNTVRREAAERAQAQTAARTQAIVDNLPLRIAYVDRELRFVFVNQAQCLRFELPREAVIGRTRAELLGAPLSEAMHKEIALALRGQTRRFEFEETVRGQTLTMAAHLVPDIAADGSVLGIYAASSDTTERHLQQRRLEQALAERETLLREVYHRVKNNLQIVQSLLNLRRRGLADGPAREALDDSVTRVRAMSLVHEKLYQTGTLSALSLRDYTADLVHELGNVADATARGIRLSTEVDDVHATLELAVPYGLLLAELVSNSLKHAFAPGQRGHIAVRMQRQSDGLWLHVQDDGVGLPPGFSLAGSTGMGLQLAGELAAQLGGLLQLGAPPGACFSVRLGRL
jgi:PAS domain S-box-containing protein